DVAGDGVGDDGGGGGGDPVASGDVAGGEFGLFHAHQCLDFFRGTAGQLVCSPALGAGGGVDPVVGQDADSVAQVEDEGHMPEQKIPQGSVAGLQDSHGGRRCGGVGEVAGVPVPSGSVGDRRCQRFGWDEPGVVG